MSDCIDVDDGVRLEHLSVVVRSLHLGEHVRLPIIKRYLEICQEDERLYRIALAIVHYPEVLPGFEKEYRVAMWLSIALPVDCKPVQSKRPNPVAVRKLRELTTIKKREEVEG